MNLGKRNAFNSEQQHETEYSDKNNEMRRFNENNSGPNASNRLYARRSNVDNTQGEWEINNKTLQSSVVQDNQYNTQGEWKHEINKALPSDNQSTEGRAADADYKESGGRDDIGSRMSFIQLLSRRFASILHNGTGRRQCGEDLSMQRPSDNSSHMSVRFSQCYVPTAIVDIQGYRQNGAFVLKSIALCNVSNFSFHVMHFQSPCPIENLSRSDYETNRYIYNNLGTLDWNCGNYPYSSRHKFISSLLRPFKRIYVKGQDKIRWLWSYAKRESEIVDLLSLDCPVIQDCVKDFNRWIQNDSELVSLQTSSTGIERVLLHVLALCLWVLRNRVEILPPSMKPQTVNSSATNEKISDTSSTVKPIIFPLYLHLSSLQEVCDLREMLIIIMDLISMDSMRCGHSQVNHEIDEFGNTVLHIAARNHSLDFLRMGVSGGGNIYHKNLYHQTPIDILIVSYLKTFLNKYPNMIVSLENPEKKTEN